MLCARQLCDGYLAHVRYGCIEFSTRAFWYIVGDQVKLLNTYYPRL